MAGKFRDFASRDWDPMVTSPAASTPNAEQPAASGPRTFGAVEDSAGVVKSAAQIQAESEGTTEEAVNKEAKTRNAARAAEPKKKAALNEHGETAEGYLPGEVMRLQTGGRSAREFARVQSEVNAARDARRAQREGRAVQPASEPVSRQQQKDAEREQRARERAETKVADIYSSHFHLFDSSTPKKDELEAAASTHPLASAGASELLGTANRIHSELSSFIRNPEPHLQRSAGHAMMVADKIDKVVPDHPYARKLREFASTITAPEFVKNVANKFGGGRGSANDAIVTAGAELALARKSASQNSEMLVSGQGTTRPVFTVANPSEQVHTRINSAIQKLSTVKTRIQSALSGTGIVHPINHVLMAAASNRAKSLVGEKQFTGQSSPDIDPVTGALSQPDHIWDHTARFRTGSEAGTAKQLRVTPENHEMLKQRGVESLIRVMATKLNEKRGGIARGERGTTAKLALSPTTITERDANTQEGIEYRAIDASKLQEHHRAYQDTKGNYYHPQTETRYRQGDLGVDNKPVKFSQTRYWKPVQE